MNKRILSIATILSAIVFYFSLTSSSSGITGQSSSGCSCHGAASANTILAVTGFPANYVNGQTYTITASVTNSAKISGGFDLTVSGGTLSAPSTGASLTGTTEIGHNAPKSLTTGTASWTFSWTAPAAGTAAITCNMAGLAANGDGQTSGDLHNIKTITIAGPASSATVTAASTSILCNGGNSIITATGVGGTQPYTYKINTANYAAANTASVPAGTYTVFVKDASQATASTLITITQPTIINANIANFTHVLCNGSCDGSASMSANGGTGALTYYWSTTPTQTTATATNLCAGTYTCYAKDANNCTKSSVVTITQPTLLVATLGAVTYPLCNGSANGSACVTATGGTLPYSYSWIPQGSTTSCNNNLVAGTYTCIVTDAKGCTVTKTVTITQPTLLVATLGNVTSPSCNGGANGSACITATGATAPYTYSWSNGNNTACANNLTAGVYTCTVSDANGCSLSKTVTITQPNQIIGTTTSGNISCATGVGSVSATAVGGTFPVSYSWMPGNIMSATASGLGIGTYTCTIQDANNCTVTTTASIIQVNGMIVNIASTNIQCFGTNNGTATTTVTGGALPLTHAWAPITATTANLTNMNAGTYTLIVTDAGTCTKTQTVLITQPTSILTASITNVGNIACNGNSNGAATVVAAGGTAGYTYNWNSSPLQLSATATGLAAGTYTATVTDANTCTKTTTVTITQSAASSIAITSTNINCNGANNGTATATVTGGASPITTLWMPGGATTNTVSGLAAGTYTYTATDANACSKTSTIVITQPTAIVATSLQGNTTCKNKTDGFVSVSPAGGVPPYTYIWTPGLATTSGIGNLAAGTYGCVIKDANNCTVSKVVTVAASTDSVNTQFTQSGNVLTAVQPNAIYQWLKCNPLSIITNAMAQSYTVTANGGYALIVRSGTCLDTSKCVNVVLNGINDIKKSGNVLSKINGNEYQFNNATNNAINFKIVNMNGAVIKIGSFVNGINNFSGNYLPKGMYVLQAINETFKMVIE